MTGPRPLAIVAIVAVHTAALATIMMGGGHASVVTVPTVMAVREIAVLPVAEASPPVTLAAIDPQLVMPVVDALPTDAGSAACGIDGSIATAMAHDREVGEALAETATARSAVMIWDGRWSAGFAPLRRVVLDQVRAARADCRDATMVGPRLLIVPTGTTTVAVAVGSGTWRWSELLA
ncbi:MAG: hypothetical protein ACRYG4_20165 [Janthinobacterium lividum]